VQAPPLKSLANRQFESFSHEAHASLVDRRRAVQTVSDFSFWNVTSRSTSSLAGARIVGAHPDRLAHSLLSSGRRSL
jgi:hypothetical protein